MRTNIIIICFFLFYVVCYTFPITPTLNEALEKKVDRIFVIMFENRGYIEVTGNSVFKNLATKGVLLSKFYAVHHPSQPNYLAQIGGETFINDDGVHDIDAKNLVDLLEKKRIDLESLYGELSW